MLVAELAELLAARLCFWYLFLVSGGKSKASPIVACCLTASRGAPHTREADAHNMRN